MDLEKCKILVARQPKHCVELLDAIRAHKGIPICQPLFAVESILLPESIALMQDHSTRAQLGIFISRNAVEIVMPYLDKNLSWQWAAIGPGTARALIDAGVKEVLYPKDSAANSKTLLRDFFAKNIVLRNAYIMIFTGFGGDEWLATELRGLGANVEVVAVYNRVMPVDLDIDINVDIILITCVTSLVNLQALYPDLDIPLLVVSARIEKVALEMGYTKVYTSNSMSDKEILSSLIQVRECKKK